MTPEQNFATADFFGIPRSVWAEAMNNGVRERIVERVAELREQLARQEEIIRRFEANGDPALLRDIYR